MKFGTLTSNFYTSDIESCERLGGRWSVVATICGGGGGDVGRIWVLGFYFGGGKGWVLGLGEGDVSDWKEEWSFRFFGFKEVVTCIWWGQKLDLLLNQI